MGPLLHCFPLCEPNMGLALQCLVWERKTNTYKVIFIFHKNVKPKHISTTLLQPVLFKEMEETKGKEEAQRVESKQSTFLRNDKVKNLTLPPSIIWL